MGARHHETQARLIFNHVLHFWSIAEPTIWMEECVLTNFCAKCSADTGFSEVFCFECTEELDRVRNARTRAEEGGEHLNYTHADAVDHPPYYQTSLGVEAVDVIEAFDLDWHLGSAVKYILRAGKKQDQPFTKDLEKAIWYLKRRTEQEDETKDR